MIFNKIREAVSKKKIRFQHDGFDLDLTYITGKLIAMGFPSEEIAGLYRNPMPEVQRFFRQRHDGNYKIYNLCTELTYEPEKFGNNVANYPFDDHNIPPLKLVLKCCRDIDEWLRGHPSRVAAVHCKAGKGRTGLMMACYFVYSGTACSAEDAMKLFAQRRTHNGQGVTIPSQKRFIKYFERYINEAFGPRIPFDFCGVPRVLTRVTLYTAPSFAADSGCEPYFQISGPPPNRTEIHDSRDTVTTEAMGKHDQQFTMHGRWPVRGEFRIRFFHQDAISLGSDDEMFHCWLHSSYIEENFSLGKWELDRACKDKRNRYFNPDFSVEFEFEDPTANDEFGEVDESPWTQGDGLSSLGSDVDAMEEQFTLREALFISRWSFRDRGEVSPSPPSRISVSSSLSSSSSEGLPFDRSKYVRGRWSGSVRRSSGSTPESTQSIKSLNGVQKLKALYEHNSNLRRSKSVTLSGDEQMPKSRVRERLEKSVSLILSRPGDKAGLKVKLTPRNAVSSPTGNGAVKSRMAAL
eukprot:50128_1